MPSDQKLEKKGEYFAKLRKLLDEYPRILIVSCDNVGSHQMQTIRHALRGNGVLLMGKKTMMRKAIRMHAAHNHKVEALLPHLCGNIGFVFTKGDVNKVRQIVLSHKVNTAAKAGVISPNDIVVPAGPTGMEPGQTQFLQALNIATKINKGQIEILSDVLLTREGERVGQSEATLLAKLNIMPFRYGLIPVSVYDNGLVYDQKVLDVSEQEVFAIARKGIVHVAALGLRIGYPTSASVPHSLLRAYKNLLAVSVASEYTFPEAERLKELISNPEAAAAAMAAAAAAVAAPVAAAAAKEEVREEPKKEEEEEEEEGDFGLDLFG